MQKGKKQWNGQFGKTMLIKNIQENIENVHRYSRKTLY